MSLASLSDVVPEKWLALDTPEGQAGFTRCEDEDGRPQIRVSHFQVSGLYCAACSTTIEAALLALPGVESAAVNASSLHAVVRWDGSQVKPSAMVAAVQRAGYSAAPDLAVSARALRQREHRQMLWRVFVAGFCMMQIMMYASPVYLAAEGDMSPDIQRLLNWAAWVLALPVLLFAAGPFWRGAWRSLRQRRISMDVPVALGLAVTFVASTGATFDPKGLWGHEVYFDSLSMFVFFLLAGRFVDMRLRHKMASRLEALVACWPEWVQRLDADDRATLVSPLALRPDDRVRMAVGQAFAADGWVIQGHTQADEALLNGESLPMPKGPGDRVVAGSVNLQAPVLIRVERVGQDTRMEGIKSLMRQALAQRPQVVQLADRWAGHFLWAVLALALTGGLVWWWIEPARAVWVLVSVLIVTCPCALSLAAPSAWLGAAGALARRGVLLNRFEALEPLSRVDQFIFDKTGTLTEDRMSLVATHVQPSAQGHSALGLLQRAARLAQTSSHPLSRALAAASPPADDASVSWSEIHEQPGCGLQACDEQGITWRLGSAAWVGGQGVTPDSSQRLLWFGPIDASLVAFEFQEVLRADAAETLRTLQSSGLKVSILSGDQADRVAVVAQQLGVTDFLGAASPEDKLAFITQAQQAGHRVAMVGDGLNDAPVLARADVSFAVAHGDSVRVTQAHAHSDAVLLSHRLSDVAQAHQIARKAMRVVRQNLIWAAGYNLLCIPLALTGYLPPWAAGLGMATSSLAVVLNAQRIAWRR